MSNPGYYEDPAEQRQRRQHLSARVPADVSQGVLSTGSLVVIGPSEFIIDFVQSLGQRPHVAARVIVPHAVMPQIVNALESSVQRFSKQFGEPAALPANPQKKKPSIRELYDEIKIGDETLAGAYANGVMITHPSLRLTFSPMCCLMPWSRPACFFRHSVYRLYSSH